MRTWGYLSAAIRTSGWLLLLGCWLQPVHGQTDSNQYAAGSSQGLASDSPLGGVGGAGGAAMADFDTLMNLIQQTVDPDSWLANGGTSTMLPYPSGVFVDPKGQLTRIRPAEQSFPQMFNVDEASPRHPWRTSSNLRTISLRKLDEALAAALTQGISAGPEIQKLAGLSKISYVKIDAANEDILICGPAGNSLFGFELQDLAVVAALANAQTAPMGCSIEPRDAGILAAQKMLQSPTASKRLARNPRMFVEQMQELIGSHQVHVFGMPANTGTAVALIDADEHMKKVGFGAAKTPTPINSYFDYLDRQAQVPNQSLIRWWFSYADSPVSVAPTGDVFELPEQCVAVLSEQQWVSQQGRAPTGGNDLAADSFAQAMTEKLNELRSSHASYARLCAVFELGLALQLGIETTGQPSLKAWLPNLCALGSVSPAENTEPQSVEGLTTWHKLSNGTIVAVVSGGVKIDARQVARKDTWQPSKFLASSVVPKTPDSPSVAHASWWWDSGL
ncbi:MAG: DUF1598 domain-containing protein [bacterium]|nr:DUF1598 domain-containing protein [bacterium]